MIDRTMLYGITYALAAQGGREKALFGDSLKRAQTALPPFMVGPQFPSVYFEHPLLGDPFLDVTVLYNRLAAGTRIVSDAAAGTDALFDWFASLKTEGNVSLGFELDTKEERPTAAGIHFQPRRRTELVRPFCELAGEPQRVDLYLDLDERMPQGWPLSFFGMFRGRPASPLRVCGYLGATEQQACANDVDHLSSVFDQIGFSANDQRMLAQIQ